MKLAYKEDLDSLAAKGCANGCHCEGDHGFWFHARCHVEAGVEVSYAANSGVIVVQCAACHAPVANIPVVSKTPSAYALAE